MASYELQAFSRFSDVSIVGALEPQGTTLNVGFWLRDPLQLIEWQTPCESVRQDFLWENTCFELFIGVKNEDFYREVNLSPSQAWQCYQFEEYRYPETMPPEHANDIDLVGLKRTHYGINATIDLALFMATHQLKWEDLFVGMCVVLNTTQGKQYFAMQHSSPEADFHNKRDWLHIF